MEPAQQGAVRETHSWRTEGEAGVCSGAKGAPMFAVQEGAAHAMLVGREDCCMLLPLALWGVLLLAPLKLNSPVVKHGWVPTTMCCSELGNLNFTLL